MEEAEKKYNEIIKKLQALKEGKNPLDLSSKEDLAIGIMNLISIEEHLFYTYNKTQDERYLELLNETREMRKSLLKEIIKDYEGENWCISKHLLAAAMRLMEVGTKKLSDGQKEEAEELFKKSYDLWNIFWGINLEILSLKDIKSDKEEKISFISDDPLPVEKKKESVFSKLGNIIKNILDCCKE
jgi:hypothetical protein